MRKAVRYLVLSERDPESLGRRIDKCLSLGWDIHGTPMQHVEKTHFDSITKFSQALVAYAPEPVKRTTKKKT